MLEKIAKSENKQSDRAERRKKFIKLAESRTRNAIRAIRTIGKLGNKNAYEYSEADVKKIAAALSKEIEAMKVRMCQSGGKQEVDFAL
jgi:hypothetical protein